MNDTAVWYAALNKPFFAPPVPLFGIVWGLLYPVIFITFSLVFYNVYKGKYSRKTAIPFVLNLFFNLIFSPIQLGTRNFALASVDIFLVVITLVWAIYEIQKYSKNLAILQLPYLVWGSFATILQLSILWLNR